MPFVVMDECSPVEKLHIHQNYILLGHVFSSVLRHKGVPPYFYGNTIISQELGPVNGFTVCSQELSPVNGFTGCSQELGPVNGFTVCSLELSPVKVFTGCLHELAL